MASRSKHSSTARPGIPGAEKNPAQVHDHTDASSITHEACSTFHEVGHLFGAPDHHTQVRGTALINTLIPGDYFNRDCIYGENKDVDTINSDQTICTGCQKVIQGEISVPEQWYDSNWNGG